MRLLFDMDKKDYEACTHSFSRPSARSIIVRDGKLAMIHSLQRDYYKFPGGGIEEGEDPIQAMIRETREEAGLIIIPESVREYGFVHRIHRSLYDPTECFIQDNYYYLCEAMKEMVPQKLDAYEEKEVFQLEWVEAALAIQKNSRAGNGSMMFEREIRVLELLRDEEIIN